MYLPLLWKSLRFPKIYKPIVVYQFYCMALFHSLKAAYSVTMNIFRKKNIFFLNHLQK